MVAEPERRLLQRSVSRRNQLKIKDFMCYFGVVHANPIAIFINTLRIITTNNLEHWT